MLTRKENLEGLVRSNALWVDGATAHLSHRRIILDLDSSESPVHGEQEEAACNGHFGSMCYHTSLSSTSSGTVRGASLRSYLVCLNLV